ncbi:MAG: outer membrane protein assembly factor BamA, partial [Candidatus Omnitrophica bacterium]|nr:outer membrane protein assembly factor BamA [Candidatus Omnitrophota bacterium]
LVVKFIVEEKSVIEDIKFKGNTAFRAPKLRAMMKSKPNEMLNLAVLAQDVAEIRDFYVTKGYPLVDVKYEIDVDKDTNKATVTIIIDEKTKVKVTKITIAGNKAVKTADIRKVLQTKPAWLFNPGIFKEDVLQDDMDRVKSLYDDIGYLDAEVTPTLNYSPDGSTLSIVININEGKQYLIGAVSVKGNLVLPEKDVWKKIKIKTGKPFSNKALREDASEIKQLYYDQGYMNMTLDVDRSLNQQTGDIDVTYVIDGKEPVYVGKIDIRGNTRTREVVIRREIRIYPGQRFSGAKIKRSKERLYNLGFFESVNFDTEPTQKPNVHDIRVTVKETKTGEFSFGGGYSSIDMLIGFTEITQKNFDIMNFPTFTGGGQNLIIKGELGMTRTNFNIGWTDPWIFGYPYSFGFDVYRMSHNKRGDIGWAYDEVRMGGDLRLGKEFTDLLRGMLTYRLEEVTISDLVSNASQELSRELGSNWISSLTLDLTFDTRDNIYNPTRGWVVNGSVEEAGGWLGGDKDFFKGTGLIAYYHTFLDKLTLELKGRGGLARPYGNSSWVPIYERFFAGGANTIRGYKERRVGPRDPGSNEPVGGEAIAIANAELTFPVYEKIIKGAVFYDIGGCWADAGDFLIGGNYKYGAGVGVRVKTPLGPVRVDWGYPLVGNYDDEKGIGEFYFSMSRGF